MVTERELEAEFAAEAEIDLDAEFVDMSPEDDTNIYELRALRLSILLEFYAQDTAIVGGVGKDDYSEEGWHRQEPWFSQMPAVPVPEINQ